MIKIERAARIAPRVPVNIYRFKVFHDILLVCSGCGEDRVKRRASNTPKIGMVLNFLSDILPCVVCCRCRCRCCSRHLFVLTHLFRYYNFRIINSKLRNGGEHASEWLGIILFLRRMAAATHSWISNTIKCRNEWCSVTYFRHMVVSHVCCCRHI